MLPERIEDLPPDFPESFRDLADYYRTKRGNHPRATNTCLPRSWDLMANFDAFARNDMISPRPLLMVTGTKAATKWYSEDGVTNEGQSDMGEASWISRNIRGLSRHLLSRRML